MTRRWNPAVKVPTRKKEMDEKTHEEKKGRKGKWEKVKKRQ